MNDKLNKQTKSETDKIITDTKDNPNSAVTEYHLNKIEDKYSEAKNEDSQMDESIEDAIAEQYRR